MELFLSVESEEPVGIFWEVYKADVEARSGVIPIEEFIDCSYFDAGDQRALLYADALEVLVKNLRASAAAEPIRIGDL